MNKIVLVLSLVLFAACNQKSTTKSTQSSSHDSSRSGQMADVVSVSDTALIPFDSANKMIDSYLTSVGAPSNDTDLRSLIVDANILREYLVSDAGSNVSHLKIMFAHRLNYINAGGRGVPCGYSTNALTAVLIGFDASGNYIYFPVDRAEDQMRPCPYECPTTGTASNDLLVK